VRRDTGYIDVAWPAGWWVAIYAVQGEVTLPRACEVGYWGLARSRLPMGKSDLHHSVHTRKLTRRKETINVPDQFRSWKPWSWAHGTWVLAVHPSLMSLSLYHMGASMERSDSRCLSNFRSPLLPSPPSVLPNGYGWYWHRSGLDFQPRTSPSGPRVTRHVRVLSKSKCQRHRKSIDSIQVPGMEVAGWHWLQYPCCIPDADASVRHIQIQIEACVYPLRHDVAS